MRVAVIGARRDGPRHRLGAQAARPRARRLRAVRGRQRARLEPRPLADLPARLRARTTTSAWRRSRSVSGASSRPRPARRCSSCTGWSRSSRRSRRAPPHTLERCGVAWERLDRERGRAPFPDPRARGLVRRRPARGRDRAGRQGARRVRARARRARAHSRAPDEVDADAVVVTAGPWVNELLDEPLPVKITRETLCYFRLDGRPADPVGRLVQARPAHARDVLAATTPSTGSRSVPTTRGPRPTRTSRASRSRS